MAVGNQGRKKVPQKARSRPMPRMLDLANVLELVDDTLNNGTTTQKQAIKVAHQLRLHALATPRNQFDSLRKERVK